MMDSIGGRISGPSKRFVIVAICASALVLVALTLIFTIHGSGGHGGNDNNGWRPTHTVPLIVAEHGMVATDNANCSVIGRNVLAAGGNAIDAAVASTLCLGVLQNFASGIGGGGIMVIRLANGTTTTFDYREWAPLASNMTMYSGNPNASLYGALAIAVPGELAGLERVHQLYGKASWSSLVQPAIELAKHAYVGAQLAETLVNNLPYINTYANQAFLDVYMPNGVLLQEGDVFKQPKLAKTLQAVADKGASVFYRGDIGSKIVQDVKSVGGILTTEDLEAYYDSSEKGGVVRRSPLRSWFQGYEIIGARPPISGGICSIFAFNILEFFNLPKDGYVAQSLHWLIEAWKFTYSDRRALGDPRFWPADEGIVELMSSKSHAAELRLRLNPNTTFDVDHYQDIADEAPVHDGGTSHLAVVDQWGNAVSTTTTVNGGFGSYFLSPSTGVLLNNQMDDFSTPNQTNLYRLPPSLANFIHPRKKPLSSMTPLIILKNDRLWMVVGGSGGSRIITATMQVVLGVLAFDRNIAEAIAFPRIHNQLIPPETIAEPDYPPEMLEQLRAKNHTFVYRNPLSAVQGIVVGADGLLYGASDWRKKGLPAGF